MAEVDEMKVKRFEKLTKDYYGFFRIGGGFSFGAYKALDDIEKAAAIAAKKQIREEEATFMMKCMLAVFDRAFAEATKIVKPPDPPKSPEEAAVGKALDELEAQRT